MLWPNPQDVAVLDIDGYQYTDWESVEVRHCLYQIPCYTVRFTCSEGMPLSKNWAAMRIKPGQWCTVRLGGILAVSGYVYSRQVFVDSKRHFIEIQAGSDIISASYASIIHPSMEFKNVTAESFLRKIFNGIGLNFKVIGQLPQTIFPRVSIPPGSSVLEGAEMMLRQVGNFPMTSSPQGGVVIIAEHRAGEDTVYEGDLGRPSYVEGRELIFNPGMHNQHYSSLQGESKDEKWGTKTKSEPFHSDPFNMGFVGGHVPLVTIPEIPSINPEQFMAGRVKAEQELQGNEQITVTVTVLGWMRPSGGLWDVDQKVRVVSPMLVMDGSMALIPKVITFTQNNQSGTRTTLELCNEQALGQAILTSTSR